MSTKKQNELARLKELLTPQSTEEELHIEADLIHMRLLDEVVRLMYEMDMSKKELADALETSKSYITQLFSGNKRLNMLTLAKLQRVLNMRIHCYATTPHEYLNIMRYDVRGDKKNTTKKQLDYSTVVLDPCMSEAGVSAA